MGDYPKQSLRERLPSGDVCLDLMQHLLEKDPTNRMAAPDALAHEYISHLRDARAETSAGRVFSWSFDQYEPTERGLKDRIYSECARMHPDMIERDAEYLARRGFQAGKVACRQASNKTSGPSR